MKRIGQVAGHHVDGAVGEVEYAEHVEEKGEAQGHEDVHGREDQNVYAGLDSQVPF